MNQLAVTHQHVEAVSSSHGEDYTALSISPLILSPYHKGLTSATIGFTGISGSVDTVSTAVQLATYSPETSVKMMGDWYKGLGGMTLHDASVYPTELLRDVISQIPSHEPLAFLQLDKETDGNITLSLGAQQKLGQLSLEKREPYAKTLGRKEARVFREVSEFQRIGRAAMGEVEFESIIVGGALMAKYLLTPLHALNHEPANKQLSI